MSEVTHEDALRQADALAGQALKETEARCAVLGQYVNDRQSQRSQAAAWSELRALHDYRAGLLRRRSLIQQALDCPVPECPAKSPLTAAPDPVRAQRQIQIQGPGR